MKISEKDRARLLAFWKAGAASDGLAARFKLSEADVLAICTQPNKTTAKPEKPAKLKQKRIFYRKPRPSVAAQAILGDCLTADEKDVLNAIHKLGPRHHAYNLVVETGIPLNRVIIARRSLIKDRLVVQRGSRRSPIWRLGPHLDALVMGRWQPETGHL